jgi:hypothetical protein
MRIATLIVVLFSVRLDAAADTLLLDPTEFDCKAFSEVTACDVISRLSPNLDAIISDIDREAEYILPRLAASDGDPNAARIIGVSLGGQYTSSYSGENSSLEAWTNPIINDPVFGIWGDWPDASIGEETPLWVRLLLARSFAVSGFLEDANAIFAQTAIAELETPQRTRGIHVRLIYGHWVASGLETEALATLPELTHLQAAWSSMGILEGFAMRGDVQAINDHAHLLTGDLSIFSTMAIAEAHRRKGETELAREYLKGAELQLPNISAGVRSLNADERLAAGYALLGDFETVERVLGSFTSNPWIVESKWLRIAPLLACHDLQRTLIEIQQQDVFADGRSNRPGLIASLLVAAAASGHQSEEAFAVAENATSSGVRQAWLLAVLIGLNQDYHLPESSIPCVTQVALGY